LNVFILNFLKFFFRWFTPSSRGKENTFQTQHTTMASTESTDHEAISSMSNADNNVQPPMMFSAPTKSCTNDTGSEVHIGRSHSLSPPYEGLHGSPKLHLPSLTLQDILQMNPLESEAETLIFKALEKKEAAKTPATRGITNLLESIPDESLHLFTAPLPIQQQRSLDEPHSPTYHHFDPFSATHQCERSNTLDTTIDNYPNVHRSSNRVLRFETLSPPKRLTSSSIPSSTLSSKRRASHILASMAEKLDEFQSFEYMSSHVPNRTGDPVDIAHSLDNYRTVPSAAEIMVKKNTSIMFRGRNKSEGQRPNNYPSSFVIPHHDDGTSSSQWGMGVVRGGTTETITGKVVTTKADSPTASRNHETNVEGSPNSVKAYKKLDTLVEDNVENASDVESGSAVQLLDRIIRDNDWRSGAVGWRRRLVKCDSSNNQPKNRIAKSQNGTWKDFQVFVLQRRDTFFNYVRYFLLIVMPALVIAFILFYFAGT
jgi:hypothetical protein